MVEEELHIKLLGMFKITFDGNVISDVNTPRLQQLLAWLLLHHKAPQNRQHLSYIFWPDSRESQAKNNLRNLLHLLRKALPEADSFIITDHATLTWNTDASYTLDLDQFKKAIADAKLTKDPIVRETKLTEAISLYGGPLLPDCYSDWIEEYREQIKLDYLFALEELTELAQTNRNYPDGIHFAKKWARDDPFNEQAWRALIRLYALNDDRANALLVYRKCVDTLRKELDIEPAPETLDLYEQLINNYREIEKPIQRTSILLPNKKWPLTGRDDEWEQLREIWKSVLSKQIEFSLIEGNSGIGKTRLSTEFAHLISKQGYPVVCTKCHKATKEVRYGTLVTCLKQEVLYGHIEQINDVWKTPLLRILPDLLSRDPDLKPPSPANNPEEQYKLLEGVSKIFQAVDKPMLLLIDDLHWCDENSLDWISYYLQNYDSTNLYLLCTYNSEAVVPGSKIEKFLEAHRNERYLKLLKLEPFGLQQTKDFISAVTGESADTTIAQNIFNSSKGNPGKIVEILTTNNTQAHSDQEVLDTPDSSENTLNNADEKKSVKQTAAIHRDTGYRDQAKSTVDKFRNVFPSKNISSLYLFILPVVILALLIIVLFERPFYSTDGPVDKKSIGILPFNNLSGDDSESVLSLGMVDILSNNLAQSSEFRVISHQSVSYYKNEYSQIQMVEELDLDFLVEGSVQTFDEQVRINIQLMDAKTSEYIWTKTYERYVGDIFFLQKEVTEDILAEVNTVLGHDVGPELVISTPRVNPDALKYFMQAKSVEGDDKISLLKQSIAIDSTFSPTHANLAIEYAFRFAFTHSEDYKQKSQQAINKALVLNPNSSLVYFAMAMLSEFSFDWGNAEKAFKKTIEFNPLNDLAYHELAQLQMRLGRFEEAIESEKRAIYLAPNSFHYQNGLGEIYLYQRDYEKAIEEMNKALQLNADYHSSHRFLAIVYMYKKDYQKALEHYDTYLRMHDKINEPTSFQGGLAQIYGYMGQKQKALDLIDTYLENNPRDTINTFIMLQLALTYTSINEVENALFWLEKGRKANAGWLIYMKVEPGFDPIRNNPRYQTIERQIFGKYSI